MKTHTVAIVQVKIAAVLVQLGIEEEEIIKVDSLSHSDGLAVIIV